MENKELAQFAEKDPELKRLLDEHQQLNKAVDALNKRHVRTAAEEQERKRLAKMKLANKDRIAQIVAKHKDTAAS